MPNSITQFLAQEESSGGTNPSALTPDEHGSLGRFQLSPGLYQDIQRAFPEFKNISFKRAALEPLLDEQVARAGMQVISRQITSELNTPATPTLIATVWQQGIGNMKKAFNKSMKTGSSVSEHLGPIGQRRLNRATKALRDPIGGQ